MSTTLPDRFLQHLREAGLFTPPGGVVLAVSGGGDSLALLELMVQVGPEFDLDLRVGHVDHGIFPDSAAVARRVEAVAARHGVPSHVVQVALGPDASETAAREARYLALRDLQKATGASYLATAHHADDQIETVLFRALRGSAPSGLAGIGSRQPDGLVRPLLPFRRAEIRAWLAEAAPGVPFDDPANIDPRHDRVWIRRELLPLLRERFGPVADDRLLDLARHAALDREAWATLLRTLPALETSISRGAIEVARPPLAAYDSPLLQAILRAAALEVGCVLGPGRAERLAAFVTSAASGRRFEIGSGWACEIAFDRVRIFFREGAAGAPEPVPWGAGQDGEIRWGQWSIRWREEPAGAVRREGWTTWVTPGAGAIRPARAGDKLRPLGGTGRRPVTRLLMEGRVARTDRAGFPLVVRGDEILWVPGICRGDSALPDPGTKAVRLDASLG